MDFFNKFFESAFNSSKDLLDKQKKNILCQNNNDLEIKEEETILKNISLVNKEISMKYKNLINKFHEILVQPFNTFTSDYKKFYSNFKIEFSNIANNLIGLKTKTNQALHNYRESTKLLQKLKKEGDKSDNNEKKRLTIENKKNEEKYKYELNQQNKLIEIFNKNYSEINHNFIEHENSLIAFLKDTIIKTNQYLKEKITMENEFIEKLNQLNDLLDIKKQTEDLKQQFNKFKRFGDRFQKEELKNEYGITQRNVNLDLDYLNKLKERNPNLDSNDLRKNSKNKKHEEIIFFIKNFIENLFSSKEVNIDEISKVMDYIYKEKDFSKQFFNCFISSKRSIFYVFSNINNLQILANIINAINVSIKKDTQYLYDINSAVIYISEKTYCKHYNEKIFLCAILSQNKFYKSKEFWIELIEFKMARRLEEHLEHLQSIQIKTENNSNKLLNAFKIFNREKNNNSLVQTSGLSKKIKGYKNLPDNKKPYLDQFAINEIEIILKEYISHLCNFNIDNEKAIDIVINIANKFQFSKEMINYFVNNIGTWIYSAKRKLPEDSHDESITQKIYEIKNSLNIWSSNYNEKKEDKIKSSNKFSLKQMLTIIIEISKFLPLSEIPKIICLSNSTRKKGRKKIFRDFLHRENLNIKDRLKIWKCLLLVSNLKEKYNYKKIIEENEYEEKLSNQVKNQIMMDIKRTSFKKEYIDNYKKALSNVLNVIAFLKPELNYCQGMSFIGSFLIQLTANEEETFYLMFGIVENTEFTSIFLSDLQKLKIFFYDFDRLIAIMVPEAYSIMTINNIKVNYFCTSWFLTMFSNTIVIVERENPPKIILKIWDEFFVKGWKAFLTTGLIIMKTNEENIKNLKSEQILQFLVSDVLKTDFFEPVFFELYQYLNEKFYIKNKLLRNLESEYFYEKNKKKNKED